MKMWSIAPVVYLSFVVAAPARAHQGPRLVGREDIAEINQLETGLADRAARVGGLIQDLEDAFGAAAKAPPDRRRLQEAIATGKFRQAALEISRELREMAQIAGDAGSRQINRVRGSVRQGWNATFRELARRGPDGSGLNSGLQLALTLRNLENDLALHAGQLEVFILSLNLARLKQILGQITTAAESFRRLTGGVPVEMATPPPPDVVDDAARDFAAL